LTFSDLAAQVQFYIVLIDIRPSSQPEQARNASARFLPRVCENSTHDINDTFRLKDHRMSGFIKGEDRFQATLFPERLIVDGEASIATQTPFAANGITTNPENGRLIMVPWAGALEFVEWDVKDESYTTIGATAGGGNYDGVEVFKGAIISACQLDTSLHVMIDGIDRKLIDLPGKPADIAIDSRRNYIAIPYVALHRVEIRRLK